MKICKKCGRENIGPGGCGCHMMAQPGDATASGEVWEEMWDLKQRIKELEYKEEKSKKAAEYWSNYHAHKTLEHQKVVQRCIDDRNHYKIKLERALKEIEKRITGDE